MNGYGRGFFSLPTVVRNLIMINAIMLLAYWVISSTLGYDLNGILGLYFPKSESFKPLQIVTHMFMHAGFWHLFFNMYALFMFGQVLENVWGPKRFLIYYLVCGLGAALVHESVIAIEYNSLVKQLSPEQIETVMSEGASLLARNRGFSDPVMQDLQILLNTPTVGASGAVFGIQLLRLLR